MALRILHIIPSTHNVGGLENGVLNLVQRLDRFQHAVCPVGNLGPLGDLLPRERVAVLQLEKSNRRFAIQIGALAEQIRAWKPDIVHSRNWGALEGVFASRWSRSAAVVHSEHGVENHPAEGPRRRIWFRRVAFELADRVLCVSSQLREMLAQCTGFPSRKMSVIHNGVDMNRFFPDPAARDRMRRQLGIGAEEICFGCVGRLYPVKDYWTLLRALEEVTESCTNWRLLIAGQGPDLVPLQQFVNERPSLAGRVNFFGVTRAVAEILNAMDVYVLPSITEGISNSLLEAMATGLPVIVSAIGGNLEVVVDGESGLMFPVGDATCLANHLLRLTKSTDLRVRMGSQALRRIQNDFSIGTMVANYERMYRGVAQGRAVS